jgi:hypothetical protein
MPQQTSQHDFTALLAMYPNTIAQMPDTFTSHEFILRLAQANQAEYVEALYSYRNETHLSTNAPFKNVHGVLSNHLSDYPNGTCRQLRHFSSTEWLC